jgi:hypothetical protein
LTSTSRASTHRGSEAVFSDVWRFPLQFAKIVFWCAAIWGFVALTPLYFLFDTIGLQSPPPITHPDFYYGFVGLGLAWQVAFAVIATDPARFRLIMVPSMLEKFSYAAAIGVLFAQQRVMPSQLVFGCIDLLLGLLFLAAFVKTKAEQ